jgi:hypothetical protein
MARTNREATVSPRSPRLTDSNGRMGNAITREHTAVITPMQRSCMLRSPFPFVWLVLLSLRALCCLLHCFLCARPRVSPCRPWGDRVGVWSASRPSSDECAADWLTASSHLHSHTQQQQQKQTKRTAAAAAATTPTAPHPTARPTHSPQPPSQSPLSPCSDDRPPRELHRQCERLRVLAHLPRRGLRRRTDHGQQRRSGSGEQPVSGSSGGTAGRSPIALALRRRCSITLRHSSAARAAAHTRSFAFLSVSVPPPAHCPLLPSLPSPRPSSPLTAPTSA